MNDVDLADLMSDLADLMSGKPSEDSAAKIAQEQTTQLLVALCLLLLKLDDNNGCKKEDIRGPRAWPEFDDARLIVRSYGKSP